MASNILSIGKSALAAAQVGVSVTGHNIANASTPGYSRQVVVQGTAMSQDFGFGFMGQGTQISSIQRIYNETLAKNVNNSQSTSNEQNTYTMQIKQIDNLLANPEAGLAPAIQDFSKICKPPTAIRVMLPRVKPYSQQPSLWPPAFKVSAPDSMKSDRM